MGKYVVIARFDDTTTNKFNELRTQLFVKGAMSQITEWPPHITFGAYENIDIKILLDWTKQFANKTREFETSFTSLGILPPGEKHPDTVVLFASPSPSKDLLDKYYSFHEKLDEYCGEIGKLYTAKSLQAIHSTIGVFEIPQIQKATEIIFQNKIFITAKIVALEVYTYPMKLIQRFNFHR